MIRYDIRRARPDEAGELTALAVRSKAHWGYDSAFMTRAAEELVIRPEQIADAPFRLVHDGEGPVGFYGLGGEPPTVVLDYLFVAPEHIGTGLGGRLWQDALATARDMGAEFLELESEPNAEGFYRSRGAERVGEVPSPVTPGRVLPYMRLRIG